MKVPKNGYYVADAYGLGWKCDRGFRVAKNRCATVKLPKNAHLDYSGNDWECDRPYQKERKGCTLR